MTETEPHCDNCGRPYEDNPNWCGECGNCTEHCANYVDCEAFA